MRSLFAPCLILPVLATMAKGATPPPDINVWRKALLGNAAASANQWYFHPESDGSPRVLVKTAGTGANVIRKLLTGGPPVWETGIGMNTANLNKQGVTAQRGNGIYFVAPHGSQLWVTFFNAAGVPTINKSVDTTGSITSVGLSAAVDSIGNLHIAYVGNPQTATETLRYARLSANGESWTKDSITTASIAASNYIQETVILATAETSARIYASLKPTNANSVPSLHRRTVNQTGIVKATGDEDLAPGVTVSPHIAGNRNLGADCVYYFSKPTAGNTWSLKQVGISTAIDTLGNVSPTSIISKAGPDAKQRIVWLDGTDKTIHYVRALGSGAFATIQPVKNTEGNAEVRGLHFDANDKPFLLYRNTGTEGFIAYPDENQDTNGNGRPDLLDAALNSNTGGVEALPTGPAVAGLPVSENKFKFRITTIGSATTNGAGGLVSISEGLTYNLETSTDAVNWTTLGAGSPVIWVQHSTTGTAPNEVKVFSGMYNETIPSAPSKRFFRVKVSRSAGAY